MSIKLHIVAYVVVHRSYLDEASPHMHVVCGTFYYDFGGKVCHFSLEKLI